MAKISAGLLMYRMTNGSPEVLLVHPGGPYWAKRDLGVWGIPKGQTDNGEKELHELLEVAKREFEEETGKKPEGEFIFLTTVRKRDGKDVYAWMFEGDMDASALVSNTCEIEWPPRSGKKLEIPEVDRGEFFDLKTAREKMMLYQMGILDAFEQKFRSSML